MFLSSLDGAAVPRADAHVPRIAPGTRFSVSAFSLNVKPVPYLLMISRVFFLDGVLLSFRMLFLLCFTLLKMCSLYFKVREIQTDFLTFHFSEGRLSSLCLFCVSCRPEMS